jgi:hypothetical protein
VRRHSKRLPLSTDIDGVVHEDDELFMPPAEAEQPPTPDAEKPATTKRPSRLQKVADAAPPANDDGVIDVPHTDVTDQPADAADHDSPI